MKAFEKPHGHQGRRSARRRGDARQPDPAGGGQLARRRLLHGEHAGPRSAARARAARTRVSRRRSRRSRAATTPHEGDWVGVSARVSALVYNTAQAGAGAAARARSSRWPRRSGRASSALRPRRPTSSRCSRAIIKLDGPAAAERWLKGLQANGDALPRQRDRRRQVNNGESALGPINHYYWYRLRDEVGAGGTALGAALLRRRGSRRPRRRLGRGGAARRARTRRRRRRSSRSSSARRARRRSPTATATSTRCAPASPPPRASGRSSSLQPRVADPGRARRRQRSARTGAEARAAVGAVVSSLAATEHRTPSRWTRTPGRAGGAGRS